MVFIIEADGGKLPDTPEYISPYIDTIPDIDNYISVDWSKYRSGMFLGSSGYDLYKVKRNIILNNVEYVPSNFLEWFQTRDSVINTKKAWLLTKGITVLNDNIFAIPIPKRHTLFPIDYTNPEWFIPVIIPSDTLIQMEKEVEATVEVMEDIAVGFQDVASGKALDDFIEWFKDILPFIVGGLILTAVIVVIGLVGYQYMQSYIAEKGAIKARK